MENAVDEVIENIEGMLEGTTEPEPQPIVEPAPVISEPIVEPEPIDKPEPIVEP